MWFKNRRAKCRQQLQQQTANNQISSKNSSSSSSRHHSSSSHSTKTSSGNQLTSTSSSSSNNNNNNATKTTIAKTNQVTNNVQSIQNQQTSSLIPSLNHTSSPNLPMTPSTSVSPPINVICKKESTLASYDSSSKTQTLPLHYQSNGATSEANNRLISGGKDSSSSSGDSGNMTTTNLGYTSTAKHDPYTTLGSKNVDLYLKNEAYGTNTDKNYLTNHLGKDHFSSPVGRVTGNLTPLGSNSSIMTTPSPPVTPQSLGSGLGSGYHPDAYNGFHWSGGPDYMKGAYGTTGHHSASYAQTAYNSPYYHSQVRHFDYSGGRLT